ncbi:MAG: hypothetical protein AB1705_16960 [Verrucomicrobiota bacterium]
MSPSDEQEVPLVPPLVDRVVRRAFCLSAVDRICRDLMESLKKDRGVDYGSGVSSPLTGKLAAMDDLIMFRVQFCGGAIDVIARDYRVEMREHESRTI